MSTSFFISRKISLASCLLFLLLISCSSFAQITLTGSATATQLANYITGSGVTVSGATLTCPPNAYASFTTVSGSFGMDSGVVLTSGRAISGAGNIGVDGNATLFANNSNSTPGDATLTSAFSTPTFDACILEFNLVPVGDTIAFNYIFGSEEYTSFACSPFNDVFGFFITGGTYTTPTNIAMVPGTSVRVCINSINCGATGGYALSTCNSLGPGAPFCTYYVNNLAGTTITYDGLTAPLTAIAAVTPLVTYHLKLAVADVSDDAYDSGVFIESPTLTSYKHTLSLPVTHSDDQLEISPNPAKDVLTFKSGPQLRKGNITIIDLAGKPVLSKQVDFSSGNVTIPLTLKKGNYSVKFTGDDGISVIKNLVVVE